MASRNLDVIHNSMTSIEVTHRSMASSKAGLWVPSIKYVTHEGGGVREGVTVCDRGGVIKSM